MPEHVAMDEWLCAACGDVIGVYEPLVVLEGDGERHTSRAAEPHLEVAHGQHYHPHCHVLLRGRRNPADPD